MVLAAREVGCGQAALDVSLFTVCVFLLSYLCIFIFYSYFLYIIFFIFYILYLFIYFYLFIYLFLFLFIYFLLFIIYFHTFCCWLQRLVAIVGLIGGLSSYAFSEHVRVCFLYIINFLLLC